MDTPIQPPSVSCRQPQPVFFPEGVPATPLYMGMPTPPPAVSYQCTRLVHLPGGSLTRLPTRTRLRRLLLSPTDVRSWCIYREDNCHAFLHQHVPAASYSLLLVQPIMHLPEGRPNDAALNRHAHAASGCLLTMHPVGASLERIPAKLPYMGAPTLPPAVSYQRTQLVHLSGR